MSSNAQKKYEKNRKEYYDFLKAFGDANPSMPLKKQHEKVPELWQEIKDDKEKISQLMQEFKLKASKIQTKRFAAWTKFSLSGNKKAEPVHTHSASRI